MNTQSTDALKMGLIPDQSRMASPCGSLPLYCCFCSFILLYISKKEKKVLHMDLIPGLNESDNQSENECSPEPKKKGLERTTLNQN